MVLTAKVINKNYLDKTLKATEKKGRMFYRIREYWWPYFIKSFELDPCGSLNALDLYMSQGQHKLLEAALLYANNIGYKLGTSEHNQRMTQVMKSSTGKMFERFIALSISYALLKYESEYCVWSYTKDLEKLTKVFEKKNFEVVASLGSRKYKTIIDADFVIFNPSYSDAEYYLVSIKSTLKDRFHNVPFWNLLRHAAISSSLKNISPTNFAELLKPKYIAICSDLAKEQPDFSAVTGPRNMLCLDAALLDGAYVTASRAKGLGRLGENHMGMDRQAPFYPLSVFVKYLCPKWK
ncbi:MAG TPA: hypothetical protein PK880_13420 [Candidatus Competibacter sp.]|nr:hypothetical protein [Candidatus Competibacter sp.]